MDGISTFFVNSRQYRNANSRESRLYQCWVTCISHIICVGLRRPRHKYTPPPSPPNRHLLLNFITVNRKVPNPLWCATLWADPSKIVTDTPQGWGKTRARRESQSVLGIRLCWKPERFGGEKARGCNQGRKFWFGLWVGGFWDSSSFLDKICISMLPGDFEVMNSNEWKGGSPHVWLMFLFYTEKILQGFRNKAASRGMGRRKHVKGRF